MQVVKSQVVVVDNERLTVGDKMEVDVSEGGVLAVGAAAAAGVAVVSATAALAMAALASAAAVRAAAALASAPAPAVEKTDAVVESDTVDDVNIYNTSCSGFDDDFCMSSELHCCTDSGNLERFRQLVEDGVTLEELDEDGATLLMLACRAGLVACLVNCNASIAHTDNGRRTVLHYVSFADGVLPVVKYFLEHGATSMKDVRMSRIFFITLLERDPWR
jgi:ankyrin repeat protein